MYVETKTLAPAVQRALANVGYGARDIETVPADEVSVSGGGGGDGRREFTLILNLDTGESRTLRGSWGGSNPWTRTLVDDSSERFPIPDNGVVIKGSAGYGPTYARIYGSRAAFGRMLPESSEPESTSDTEQQALYCFASIKGGEYRREELARRNVSPETVEGLIARGYLKRNKAGATSITTAGKNARDRSRVRY